MRKGWSVTTFVSSELPLTDKIADIQSYTFLVLTEEPPEPGIIEAFVRAHLQNFSPVYSELQPFEYDEKLFKPD